MAPKIKQTIYLPAEGLVALRWAAQQSGVSVSEAVRILIRQDIKTWDSESPRRALDECFGDFVRCFGDRGGDRTEFVDEGHKSPDLEPDSYGIGPLADFLVGDEAAGFAPRPDLHTYAAISAAIPEDDDALWDALPTAWNLYTQAA